MICYNFGHETRVRTACRRLFREESSDGVLVGPAAGRQDDIGKCSSAECNDVLKPRYAVQVAIEADGAGVNPLEYEGRPVKVSAADFLAVFI